MRQANAKKELNMTSGPMLISIIRFMFPLIATNLLQHLYHSADIIIVGLSSEPDAVGAIGATSSYLALIRNVFIGFSLGANVVIARHIGAKNRENTEKAVHTAVCMSVLFGFLGALVGILFARPMLVSMGFSGKLLTLAVQYAYVYLACLPFLSLTNFLSAILHAQGNTKTSLYVLTATGLLNVALNLFFVLVVGMSVTGVALATAIANLVSAAVLFLHLVKRGESCRIQFLKLKINREPFIDILRIGFPSGVQNALFSLSNLVIQSSILRVNNAVTPVGSAYAPVVKANAATSDIEAFIFTALAAVTTTASAFTAQNVGAGNPRRVKRAFYEVGAISIVLAAIIPTLAILFREPLLSLYGVKQGEDILSQIAYSAAEAKVFWKWTLFIPYALMNASTGTIRGMGRSMTSAIITLIGTCAFRVLWIYTVFERWQTLEIIYVSYPISWVLTGAVSILFLFLILRKEIILKDSV